MRIRVRNKSARLAELQAVEVQLRRIPSTYEKELLRDKDVSIDSNWRPMLEFALLSFAVQVRPKSSYLRSLRKNKQMAGDLFKRLSLSRPELSESWAADFRYSYGEAMLE